MNNKFSLLLLSLLSFFVQASELIIADGDTYTVTDSQRELHLKKLIIGDKATINFSRGVAYWDVSADYVEVGRNVVIDGRGADGADGLSGVSIVERAGDCEAGKHGNNGEPGARGANGIDIQMKLAVAKLGSMKVLLDGGKGGRGGDGGMGQQGGMAKSCDPTDGGDGGDAGPGGSGGNGGKLIISLSAATPDLSLMALSHQVEASAAAGRFGNGGEGGEGGMGSEGQFINQKTLTGDKKWVSGGKKGKSGKAGETGKAGVEGRVFIGGGEMNVLPIKDNLIVRSIDKTVTNDQSPRHELEELRAQLQLIQQRLDALESRLH